MNDRRVNMLLMMLQILLLAGWAASFFPGMRPWFTFGTAVFLSIAIIGIFVVNLICYRAESQAAIVLKAIRDVHAEHADDLCWMPADVNRIFEAAGLPPQDLHVGDKAAMRKNCDRYVDVLCDGGKWLSYAELEAALHAARAHPWYTYIIVPANDQATFARWSAGGSWDPNPEYAAVPGDTCWRRRKDS